MKIQMKALSLVTAVFTACLAAPVSAQNEDGPRLEPHDCPAPLADQARCGTVRVAEGGRQSRAIDLNVVILPSVGAVRHPPLFDLDGGPGLPATKNFVFYLTDGAAYRQGRDIILIDQRGTGASNPLLCPDLSAPELQYQPMYPPALVEACRARLSQIADLAAYGTDATASDLDRVRRALGADRIDLIALSYGTSAALRYMANYPGRTRAAVLFGTAPPGAMPPRSHAPAARRTLRLLFAGCAADPACHAAFPDPDADLRQALARLPTIMDAPAPEVFLEAIRSLLYSPMSARAVPLILHHAAYGDLRPFFARTRRTQPSILADGVYLSITCSESFGAMDYEEAAAAARATLFGDYRLRRQREACASWPRFPVAPDFADPPAPAVPLLLISGELDPVTPPAWAESVAQASPHARHLILPGAGHVFEGLSGVDTCLDPLIVAFLDRPDPAQVEASCVARMRPPPFLTSFTE